CRVYRSATGARADTNVQRGIALLGRVAACEAGLRGDHLAHHAPRLVRRGVDPDVDDGRVRIPIDLALLRLEDRPVLLESGIDLVEQPVGDGLIAWREVMRLRPEVVHGPLALRRDRIQVVHVDTAVAPALARAGVRRLTADVEPHK